MATEAKIVLAAEDRTKAAFESTKKGLTDLHTKAVAVSGVFATLGVSLSMAGLSAAVKQVADSLDAFNDLKDATGASIENLSGLENVARRAGTSFDTVGQSLVKFNDALGKTSKPGSDVEKVLKAIGLNVKELRALDPAQGLLQTATALNQFADDGEKARAVQVLFGKSLKEVAPFLKDLAEEGKLVATVTAEQAEEAEKFNKGLSALNSKLVDMSRQMAGPVLTTLNNIAESFGKAESGGNSLADVVGGGLRVSLQTLGVLGHEVAFVFQGVGREIGGVAAQLAALARGDFKGFSVIGDELRADAERARRENDAAIARIMSGSTGTTAGGSRSPAPRGRSLVVDLSDADKAAAAERKRRQREEFDEAMKIAKERQRMRAEEQKSIDDHEKREEEIATQREDRARETLAQIEFEIQLLGMSTVEREKAIAARELETKGIKEGTLAWEEYGARIVEAAGRRAAAQQQIDQFKDVWSSIDSTAHDVFVNIFDQGEDVFKRLGNTLKASVLDLLYQMTLKPWIVNVVANATGTPLGTALGAAGMAGGGGMSGLLGAALQFGGSPIHALSGLAGSMGFGNFAAGLAGAGGSFASTIGAGLATDALGATVIEGAAAATLGSTGAGLGGMLAAAGPWLPLAAMALPLLGGLFEGGGPKYQGYYNPYNARKYSTTNDPVAAASARSFAGGLQSQFDAISGAFGGNSGLKFGAGFITDPEGDSPTIARIGVGKKGRELFDFYRDDIGRSEQELQAAMTQMGSRALLKALQLEDIGGKLGAYLTKLGDVSTLTATQVEESVAKIQAAGMQRATLEEQIYQLTATSEQKLLRARQAELDAIDESNEALLRRVWKLQDERTAAAQLEDALANASSSSRAYLEFIQGTNTGIRQFIDGLNATPVGMLNSKDQLSNARAQFREQFALASKGDRGARQDILQYAQQLIEAQTAYTASGPQTRKTIEWVQKMLESLPGMETGEEYLARVIQEEDDETRSELRALGDKIWAGLWGSGGLLAARMDAMDSNGNGKLSFKELQATLGTMASPGTLRRLIGMADTNKDGSLSRFEVRRMSGAAGVNITRKPTTETIERVPPAPKPPISAESQSPYEVGLTANAVNTMERNVTTNLQAMLKQNVAMLKQNGQLGTQELLLLRKLVTSTEALAKRGTLNTDPVRV